MPEPNAGQVVVMIEGTGALDVTGMPESLEFSVSWSDKSITARGAAAWLGYWVHRLLALLGPCGTPGGSGGEPGGGEAAPPRYIY